MQGCRCPYCSGRCATSATGIAATYPELAARWHPNKYGMLTQFDVVVATLLMVWWQCPLASDQGWPAKG